MDELGVSWEPYDVTCDRCGVTLSCEDAYVGEGDEWECEECWYRCENKERAEQGLPPLLKPQWGNTDG